MMYRFHTVRLDGDVLSTTYDSTKAVMIARSCKLTFPEAQVTLNGVTL